MNKTKLAGLLLGFSLSTLAAPMPATPIREDILAQNVYTPEGFSTNENAQIIVTGILPNLCHKSPQATKEVSDKTIRINLTSLVYDSSNVFCPEAVLPFDKTIDLGELDEGTYNVIINEGTQNEIQEKLTIDKTDEVNTNPKLIYANVTDIQISNSNAADITLKAYNPSDCFEVDEIIINSDQKGTYTVSPILKQKNDFCAYKMTPFDININLPVQDGDENILLHVKTMDGDSINRIINPQIL